jgi:RNA polymerase sigma-70 factor (ECF subfamily)
MSRSGETSEGHLKRDVLVTAFIAASPMILRHVTRIVKHPEDAEDVMQDTIYSALGASDKFRGDSQVSTWLYRIAHNKALDKIALVRAHYEIPHSPQDFPTLSTDFTPEAAIIQGEEFTAIIEEIKALSLPEQKTILMQAYGLSIEEISSLLDIKEETIKSHGLRGRVKFQKNREAA